MLWMIAGCSEYSLFGKQQPEEAVQEIFEPKIMIEPQPIDVGLLCSQSHKEALFVIKNIGNGRLDIFSIETTNTWELTENFVPFSLEEGEEKTLFVLSGDSQGALWIESNDGSYEIPLLVDFDMPPDITWLDPHPGAIIDQETSLAVEITDDYTPSEDISVKWLSDQDGLFAQGNAVDASQVVWSMTQSVGIHQIDVRASDTCRTSSIQGSICQQQEFILDDLGFDSWHTEGTAYWDETNILLSLTPTQRYVVGSAFSVAQEVYAGSVDIQFSFFIGEGTGADGLSLTLLDVDRMSTFLGGTGCGIGYGGDAPCTPGPALPGWTIEVDTFYNEGYDPTDLDHLTFTFDGDVDEPFAWAELPEMEDTGWHTINIRVQEPRVEIAVDGVVYIEQDIPGFFDFEAYIGFTAGTGNLTNVHQIRDIIVKEGICSD